jgi:hypothetical protein
MSLTWGWDEPDTLEFGPFARVDVVSPGVVVVILTIGASEARGSVD